MSFVSSVGTFSLRVQPPGSGADSLTKETRSGQHTVDQGPGSPRQTHAGAVALAAAFAAAPVFASAGF